MYNSKSSNHIYLYIYTNIFLTNIYNFFLPNGVKGGSVAGKWPMEGRWGLGHLAYSGDVGKMVMGVMHGSCTNRGSWGWSKTSGLAGGGREREIKIRKKGKIRFYSSPLILISKSMTLEGNVVFSAKKTMLH